MAIRTLTELFFVAAGYDKPDCLLHKAGGEWQPIATRELVDRVQRLAKALREIGVVRGDRVALMAENGPHWPAVDFAALCSGAVLVPIYPTLLPEGASYIVNDSGAKVLFVQGQERLDGLLALRKDMPQLQHVVRIDGGSGKPGDGFTSLDALLERGAGADRAAFEAEAKKAQPDDLATFIYTSGTTGNPKGVMLTHGNIASNVSSGAECIIIQRDYTALSFLPLSHSFERTVDYIYFYRGATIAYAESVNTVPQNLVEVKPHVFVSVPRVYEKFQARVLDTVSKSPAWRQRLFQWGLDLGREAMPYRLKNERPPGLLGTKLAVADRLVFSKIKARLGGRFVFATSGGAPLARELAEFFWAAGVPIYEGYGLTETSPVLTVNTPERARLGSVGPTIPGVSLQIAADGEILGKGPNIMKGYYNNPEATAEVIDSEGWFHTGDIGHLDADGFLFITDRKKELIVNAYGKNIAPAPIENALKASRYISQAVVLGDKRKFLTALVVPDFDALRPWARAQGVSFANDEELVKAPQVRKLIAAEVEPVNAKLARYERIQAWDLIPAEFTIEGGELTPTQKVKRRIINTKYKDVIDALYRAADAGGD
ncbi:MAG TPA: long-chain fatty acid--CoA ligase [Thermoanaerobaculia bacterium]|jgi:long-chain acyl-CoA synthetase|nr:long-chain fatty acid--CoA ligase [Thermoanaerobaculia bacterium]